MSVDLSDIDREETFSGNELLMLSTDFPCTYFVHVWCWVFPCASRIKYYLRRHL